MTKSEFLSLLKAELGAAKVKDKEEILSDYDEHFRMGIEAGKSEDEIAKGLGDPKLIARQFRADSLVKQAEESKTVTNITRAIIAIIGLGFFNLIFVLGPFLAVMGVMLGLFIASLGITFGGAVAFVATLLRLPVLAHINPLAALFLSTGLTALGLLLFIAVCYIGKFVYNVTLNYLRLNLSIIRK